MRRRSLVGVAAVLFSTLASAEPASLFDPGDRPPTLTTAARGAQQQPDLGGGFIEFLFGGGQAPQPPQNSQHWYGPPPEPSHQDGFRESIVDPLPERRYEARIDPRYLRQDVAYSGQEPPGTIVIVELPFSDAGTSAGS